MLDLIKDGFKKVIDVIEDITYHIPSKMLFIIQCSLICLFWIILVC